MPGWEEHYRSLPDYLAVPEFRSCWDAAERARYAGAPWIPEFAKFSSWRGRRVLDVGSGTGADALNFARHGAQVVAMDYSESATGWAQKRFELYGVRARAVTQNACDYASVSERYNADLFYSVGLLGSVAFPGNVLYNLRTIASLHTELRIAVLHTKYARRDPMALSVLSRHAVKKLLHHNGWDLRELHNHSTHFTIFALPMME